MTNEAILDEVIERRTRMNAILIIKPIRHLIRYNHFIAILMKEKIIGKRFKVRPN